MVINGPTRLIGLFKATPSLRNSGTAGRITAEGQNEIEAALYAALCDGVDFIFVPKPTPFALFAQGSKPFNIGLVLQYFHCFAIKPLGVACDYLDVLMIPRHGLIILLTATNRRKRCSTWLV